MSPFSVNENSLCSQSTIQVELGNVCCAVVCHDRLLYSELQHIFVNFQSLNPPDITIELKIVDGRNLSEFNTILHRTRLFREGNHFIADDLVLECEFHASDHFLSFKVERSFFNPDAEFKLMNRILSLAYYTVCRFKYNGLPPAMLVHSSGIIRQGKALLFTGPSGSGKTTVTRLCDREQGEVLNDEMTLVSRQSGDGTITARGIPIIGDLSQKLNIEAPLRAVFSIKQSKRTTLRRLSRIEAYMCFMRQIISPAYFGLTNKQELFSQITEFSDEITRTIPFYELEFTLDKERLWQAVGELEETLEKEEVESG